MLRFKPLPLVLAVIGLFSYSAVTWADSTAQSLPFTQDWSNSRIPVSFNDTGLIGTDSEYLKADTPNLNFHNSAYTHANTAAAIEVASTEGVFHGLSFATESSDPEFALTPGVFDATSVIFVSQPVDTQPVVVVPDYGSIYIYAPVPFNIPVVVVAPDYGTLIYTPAPVPEPEPYAMLLAGLGLLGFMARKRH
ncbi:PEP-CTERM sorting domain-containing protein [Sulfuriferula multivorans]|uniref:PEP-CTERM sorting domain-containing protein n=1 Tax=Sulfuriferula multivorans TaxID=1559896 RepID=UPI001CB91A0B|nr:PEP-CTERM sorting domain-containing protein [Sulfuriferula multivorans]